MISEIIVVVGPTASGKSALAVKIAKFLESRKARGKFRINGAEIISADSRQVYKELDIGTGKVRCDRVKNQKKYFYKGIQHHLLDVAHPKRQFSVVQYQKLGRKALEQILKKKKIPIIAGGTGLYIDALLYGFKFPEVKPDIAIRKELERSTVEELYEELRKLDPTRAESIDKRNPRRLVRALEIAIRTGKPSPALGETVNRLSKYNILKIGLNPPPEILKKLIHLRLMRRLRTGMVAEVENLKKLGLSSKRLNELGFEYRAINFFLEGKINQHEMTRMIEADSWHYAKRQMTWWRRDKEILWLKNNNIFPAKNSLSSFLKK